uniref:uncharacterized protein isoform X4 n=1 Tax=Myxine glutinosa TaxID=7769 RepID=UPI00358E654C
MHRLLRLHYFDSVNNNSAGRDLFAFKGDPFAHGILGLPPLLRDPRAVFVPSALSKRKLCDDGWHDLDGLEEAEGPRAGKMHVRSLPPEEFMHEIYRPMSKHPCYAVPMPIGCHEGPDSPTRLLNNSQLQQQVRRYVRLERNWNQNAIVWRVSRRTAVMTSDVITSPCHVTRPSALIGIRLKGHTYTHTYIWTRTNTVLDGFALWAKP